MECANCRNDWLIHMSAARVEAIDDFTEKTPHHHKLEKPLIEVNTKKKIIIRFAKSLKRTSRKKGNSQRRKVCSLRFRCSSD